MKKIITILVVAWASVSVNPAAYAVDPPPLPPLPALPSPSTQSANTPPALPELKLPDNNAAAPSLPPLPGAATTGTAATTPKVVESLPAPPSPFGSPIFPEAAKTESKADAKKDNTPPALVPPPLSLTSDVPPPPPVAEEAPAAEPAPKAKHPAKKIAAERADHNLHPTYYISEPLPEAIYRKSYDRFNRHLPVAYYERDYDRLVFTTAAHNDLNGLRSLLDNGRNVELTDTAGDTPLLVAVKYGAINTARLLLARHANPEVMDRSGLTPMQIAVRKRNYPMQRALLEMGACPAPVQVSYAR